MEVLELQGSGVFSVIPYYFLRHCTTFFPQAFHAFVIRPSYSFRNLVHLFAKMDLWDAPLHRERGVCIAWNQLPLNQSTLLRVDSLCPRGEQENILTSLSADSPAYQRSHLPGLEPWQKNLLLSHIPSILLQCFCFSLDCISSEDGFPSCLSSNYGHHKKMNNFYTRPF